MGLWLSLLVCDMTAAQSLPADRAENAAPAKARGGQVMPGPDGVLRLAAFEAAVLTDAARMWQLGDLKGLTVEVEELNWSDGSLGCPQHGMAYTQALVPGWRLVVRHDRFEHRVAAYHASRRGQWLLCPGAPPSSPPVGDATR